MLLSFIQRRMGEVEIRSTRLVAEVYVLVAGNEIYRILCQQERG